MNNYDFDLWGINDKSTWQTSKKKVMAYQANWLIDLSNRCTRTYSARNKKEKQELGRAKRHLAPFDWKQAIAPKHLTWAACYLMGKAFDAELIQLHPEVDVFLGLATESVNETRVELGYKPAPIDLGRIWTEHSRSGRPDREWCISPRPIPKAFRGRTKDMLDGMHEERYAQIRSQRVDQVHIIAVAIHMLMYEPLLVWGKIVTVDDLFNEVQKVYETSEE